MITVLHKRDATGASNEFYIGRPSPLGNPFTHKKGTRAHTVVSSREEAVARYKTWLNEQWNMGNSGVHRELTKLLHAAMKEDIFLVCWCTPLACHGDVVKEALEGMLKRAQE
jgi:hypothetical protein